MTGKRIGYKRVSTEDQNPDRQLEGIPLDKVYIEYATGKTVARPQLNAMLDYAREDDIIIVHSLDRLARNVKDLRKIVDDLTDRGISIQFIKENLVFTGDDSPMSNLLLTMLGAFAEFEHSLIRERQLEGIQIAKRLGRYKGRKKCIDAEKLEHLLEEMKTRKSITQISEEMNVSRFTIYKYLKSAGFVFDKSKFPKKKMEKNNER